MARAAHHLDASCELRTLQRFGTLVRARIWGPLVFSTDGDTPGMFANVFTPVRLCSAVGCSDACAQLGIRAPDSMASKHHLNIT